MARSGKQADKYLSKYKSRLLSGLSGTVVEIGPGAGANLRYLCTVGIRWIGVEPNPFMEKYLVHEARRLGIEIELRTGTAEDLPAEDASADFVISTLVLCSVVDQKRALDEILRVLKPSGQLLFIEHVAAGRATSQRRIQTLAKPLWRRMGDGCQPDRETVTALQGAGFATLDFEEFMATIPVVRPHIAGIAAKAGPSNRGVSPNEH